MQIVVGLGNPGKEFEHTYHNAGALALKALVAARIDGTLTGAAMNKNKKVVEFKKYKSFFEYATIGNIVFVRPLTYMNDSGIAVRAALKKFGMSAAAGLKDLVVIQDDSDITIGNFKISFARNAGGHNGIQSIIDALGTNAFYRIRIGIRPATETKRKKAGDFALKSIEPTYSNLLAGVFSCIAAKIGKSNGLLVIK